MRRMEVYNWRDREAYFNSSFAQFRTALRIDGELRDLRVHFVHARSSRQGAVPLLLLPSYPLTNLSLPKSLLKSLTEPEDEATTAFHVVVPSLPGTGFSDAFTTSSPNVLEKSAGLFDALMQRLGYAFYLCSGTES